MKIALTSLASLLVASSLAAQTPTNVEYRYRVGVPVPVGLANYNLTGGADGFRFKLTNQKGVTVQWGTDIPASRLVPDASNVFGGFMTSLSYPVVGTYDVQICAFGQVLDEATVVWKTVENCSDKGLVTLVLNRNSIDKPTTIIISLPPGAAASSTVSPTGTSTTTAPK